MTKKDYIRIADMLFNLQPTKCLEPDTYRILRTSWRDTVIAHADLLASDNSRFEREKFYRAAGLEIEERP